MLNDQAQNLRKFVNKKAEQNIKENDCRVICISSGKGGVGKSNFTTNLAFELSNRNKKVIIIDADFGLANIEILLGVVSKKSFLDLLTNESEIKNIITKVNENIGLISGGSGILELANVSDARLNTVINSIATLSNIADFILIDTGAGISNVVTSFAQLAQEIIVITTCEPTSVADAYALIKTINNKNLEKKIKIVINKADTIKEANTIFENISSVSKKFINKDLEFLGFIYNDNNVAKSVKKQVPFLNSFPSSKASKCISNICDKVLSENIDQENFISLVDKFKRLFR